jgi:hypothetical protein
MSLIARLFGIWYIIASMRSMTLSDVTPVDIAHQICKGTPGDGQVGQRYGMLGMEMPQKYV